MGVAYEALQLFGNEHVNVGTWMGPVKLLNVSEEEAQTFLSLFREQIPEIKMEKDQ